jgi:glyoxylase-like metal-dependent hydrolase (beta-lactamase superfamily II)
MNLKKSTMNIYPVNTGNFKLDGGAMFGVVPKTLWQRTNPADDNNMCSWAMRSLLIEEGNRLTLVDCGMGDKQSEKFFGFYYLHGDDTLDKSLAAHGFSRDDITDVFLTHLHFDHCGGAIQFNKDKTGYEPAFKNARFWSNERHWKWATEPNPREKASFLKENILPIEESGQLNFVDAAEDSFIISTDLGFDAVVVNGHTDAQMCPMLDINGRKLVFMADLLPSTGHIPLPYVMGYDTRPLLTMDEKKQFLDLAADNDYLLFLEHDAVNEVCTVKQTEKGVRLDQVGMLVDFI